MKVVAKTRGHDGTRIREEGDVFELPPHQSVDEYAWYEAVEEEEQKKTPKKNSTPIA